MYLQCRIEKSNVFNGLASVKFLHAEGWVLLVQRLLHLLYMSAAPVHYGARKRAVFVHYFGYRLGTELAKLLGMGNIAAFTTHRRRSLAIYSERDTDKADKVFLSDNGKVGVSINMPVAHTCQPTEGCMKYCYAVRGQLAYPNAMGRQYDNLAVLESAAGNPARARELAGDIAGELLAGKQDFIRWNGVGDLTPGSVAVINALAELAPWLAQWVVTRRVDMAEKVADLAPIRLMLSADDTTPAPRLKALLALRKHFKRAAVRMAWTRTSEATPPAWVDVIFNEHGGGRRKGYEDKRTCHATMPEGKHGLACPECRRCFADRS